VLPHDVEVHVVSGSLPERAGAMENLVTNWWVERCLYGKRLVDPTADVLSRPFDKLSISGKLLAPVQILYGNADVCRVFWPDCKLDGVLWDRALTCDEGYYAHGYGNKLFT